MAHIDIHLSSPSTSAHRPFLQDRLRCSVTRSYQASIYYEMNASGSSGTHLMHPGYRISQTDLYLPRLPSSALRQLTSSVIRNSYQQGPYQSTGTWLLAGCTGQPGPVLQPKASSELASTLLLTQDTEFQAFVIESIG